MLSWSFEHGKKHNKHGEFWYSKFVSLIIQAFIIFSTQDYVPASKKADTHFTNNSMMPR